MSSSFYMVLDMLVAMADLGYGGPWLWRTVTPHSCAETFRELNKLHCSIVAAFYDNLKRCYSHKKTILIFWPIETLTLG